MPRDSLLKPIAVFVLVIVLLVALAGVGGLLFGGGGGGGAGGSYSQQVPAQYEPSSVVHEPDPETGEIDLDSDGERKTILIDTSHSNRIDRAGLEPVTDALARAGHSVHYSGVGDAGLGSGGLTNATLQQYDAILIAQPTSSFSAGEIAALQTFADAGGRIAVLAEPTTSGSGGFGSQQVTENVNGLTTSFGLRVMSDQLYNVNDTGNDNNYKSIYAAASADDPLTESAQRVSFDTSTYLVEMPRSSDIVTSGGPIKSLYTAVNGTQKLSTRRTGEYTVAARSGNLIVAADASFITAPEAYDVDNEQFITNVLEFLLAGDKPPDVPATPTDSGGF